MRLQLTGGLPLFSELPRRLIFGNPYSPSRIPTRDRKKHGWLNIQLVSRSRTATPEGPQLGSPRCRVIVGPRSYCIAAFPAAVAFVPPLSLLPAKVLWYSSDSRLRSRDTPSLKSCAYSPGCLAEFFSETGLPVELGGKDLLRARFKTSSATGIGGKGGCKYQLRCPFTRGSATRSLALGTTVFFCRPCLVLSHRSLIVLRAFDGIAREMRVMRRNQLKLTISIVMAVVVSVLAAGPAFAVTCAVDCNPIRGPLGRVVSLQG